MKNNGFKIPKPGKHVPNDFLPTKQTNILESIKDICDMCDKQEYSKEMEQYLEKAMHEDTNQGSDRFKKRAKKQKQKIANQNYNLEHKSSVPKEDIKINHISTLKLEY